MALNDKIGYYLLRIKAHPESRSARVRSQCRLSGTIYLESVSSDLIWNSMKQMGSYDQNVQEAGNRRHTVCVMYNL